MSRASSAPTASAHPATAEPSGRWRILSLLGVGQLLGMSLWVTASATAARLAELWGMEAATAAALTTAVQIGFVAGTALAALLNLADLLPARVYVAASAVLAAAANAALLFVSGPDAALAARFFTGFFLAGVYPPAMKMAATWFQASRGLAIGVIVGALTVGKALPYLVNAMAQLDYRFVIQTTSGGALFAALLVLTGYRDGPFAFQRRAFSWSLAAAVLRHRPTRLAIAGYLGHMWELYAMWALISLFFLDHWAAMGADSPSAAMAAGLATFAVIAAGGLGSVVAGLSADRWGRENVAAAAMVLSGACALLMGWLTIAPTTLVLFVALLWGLTIVADSAQFSALVTEVAPPHAVGTALTLQTCMGFALTALSIALTALVAQQVGWTAAFSMLAVGPALGVWAMLRLKRARL
jgi:MFS family permease